MEVQEVKEQLKAIFRQVINNTKVDNGWITTDRTDDEGNPIRVYIEGYHGESRAEKNRKAEILKNFKKDDETKYDFTHTRAKLNDTQKAQIKKIIGDIYTRDNDGIIWEEEFGYGYPIDEEAYDEMQKKKNDTKNNNADNSTDDTVIAGIKGIVNNCKPETEQDYKVLNGIKEILENLGE